MSEMRKAPLAVALHYEKPGAPRVTAKGRGEVGQRIIEAARAHGVPIEENAGLAEGVNIREGQVTNSAVAETFGLACAAH